MQDKDFDKLFSSKLNDLEIEPPANVWEGVSAELNGGHRKKQYIQYLSMAAGVILLVTVGLLFIPKPVKIDKRQTGNRIAKNVSAAKRLSAHKIIAALAIPSQNKKTIPAVIAPVDNLANLSKVKAQHAVTVIPDVSTKESKSEMERTDSQPALASATESHAVINPVVPDSTTKLKPVITENTYVANKPVMAQSAPVGEKQISPPVKKRKIRSFGDLLNVAIAAVDKRKDKIIEFSNTDEDDATITGVNLGVIKVKREK